MTIIELMNLAREREIGITSVAFEYWDYLDSETQRAIGRELCALAEEDTDYDLKNNLFEYESGLFAEHFISVVTDLINGGEGQSLLINEELEDLFKFVVEAIPADEFTIEECKMIDSYMSMARSYRYFDEDTEEEDKYYTTTCDFISLLEKILSRLADL